MMLDVGVNVITTTVGIVFAAVLVIGLASILFSKRMPEDGLLQYYFYAVLLAAALTMLLSGRDFSSEEGQYFKSAITSNPIAEWSTRFASLFTMLAALERVLNFFTHYQLNGSRLLLLGIVSYFWITNLFIPVFITANQPIEFTYFYSLALMIGIVLSNQINSHQMILNARNAFVFFTLLSLAFIFISPNSALDFEYTQGYIPGLPRFFGLSPHAIVMSTIITLALWSSMAYPFQNSKFQASILLLGIVALILTQSKTVLFSFMIGAAIIYHYKEKNSLSKLNSYKGKTTVKLVTFSSILLLIILFSLFFLSDYEKIVYNYVSSDTIQKITSVTGRDEIWLVALEEFHHSPWFGYGNELFSESYRISVNMPFATGSHNQFIDSLARSGIIGFSGLIILFSFFFYFSIKLSAITNGLSMAIITYILLFSLTAEPISLTNIGTSTISFYFLLFIISAHLYSIVKIKTKI